MGSNLQKWSWALSKKIVHYCEKLMGVVVFAKVQGPKGSAEFLEVVTFLTKIQKSEGNSTTLKNWIQKLEGKPTTLKNWIQKMEGNSTTPKNCVLTIFLNERSKIFFLVFSLIWFWIFVRNENCFYGYLASFYIGWN